ncbi:MAG: ABC transporter ATP-binding protein [Lachnospiraceae bacterium]|nr:ABC transporter ATP-binding protein [Lachnospiraceae bacterium]
MPPGGGGGGRGGGPHGRVQFLTEEEKKNRAKVTLPFVKRILSYLSPYKLQVFWIILLNISHAGIGLLPPLITASIVDKALYGKNGKLLLILIGADLVIIIVSGLLQLLQRYVNSKLSQNMIRDMRNEMYSHLTNMSQSFFTNERPGDIITRMTADIDGVQNVLTETLTSLISNIFVIVFTAVTLFAMNWMLGLVSLILVPLMQIPTRWAAKKRWLLTKEAQEQRDIQNQQVSETLSVSGSTLVKLYNREEKEISSFRATNDKVTDITIKEQATGQSSQALMQFFTQLGPVIIYLTGGLLLLKNTGMTVGTIVAVVALVSRLYMPVASLFNIQVTFTRSFALFERIFAYLDIKPEIIENSTPIHRQHIKGDVTFDHVSFSYRKGRPVLKDVDFTIPEGKTYAIVGISGAGKTTITNLIPRLFDVDKGAVRIGGIDVRDYSLTDLRKGIGIVTQETYLFNGTIRENLLYAKEDATQEEMEAACRAANIHNYIASLPDGYDSMVGNRGLRLSGGEKQRISIARVLLKDPDIIILDEATSSLDSIAEDSIQDAIEPLLVGRTSLIIAHRLSTILSADKIMVLNDGRIEEMGTHSELIEMEGTYRKLFDTQFKRAVGPAVS